MNSYHSDIINSDVFSKKVGYFIRYKRKDLNMTGKTLGIMLNVSQQQISRYEKGITKINITLLNDILIILGVSWDEFLSFIRSSNKI